MPSACDVLPNDQTNQKIKSKKSKQQDKLKNGPVNGHENGETTVEEIFCADEVSMTDEPAATTAATAADKTKTEQELVFIHDAAFTIKISCPGIETFDLQVVFFSHSHYDRQP